MCAGGFPWMNTSQCAVANPHLRIHFKVRLLKKDKGGEAVLEDSDWQTYSRAVDTLPRIPEAIRPHPTASNWAF